MSNTPKSLLDFHQAGWHVIAKCGRITVKKLSTAADFEKGKRPMIRTVSLHTLTRSRRTGSYLACVNQDGQSFSNAAMLTRSCRNANSVFTSSCVKPSPPLEGES